MARYRAGIETRQRILEAARGLLGEVGLEGTTIKAVCDRAEIGAGSFYNLFGSKEEAVLAVVREAINAVDPEATDHAAKESVEDLVDAYLAFVTGSPDLARVYLQAAASWGLNDPRLGDRFRRHQDARLARFEAALRRDDRASDASDAEIRARARQLLAALYGLTMSWFLDPGLDLRAHRDRLLGEGV